MSTIKKEKSIYKNVYICLYNGKQTRYMAQISLKGSKIQKLFDIEKEAAICVDKFLIKNGKEPVNILTKKND